jgi:urocanate reductase
MKHFLFLVLILVILISGCAIIGGSLNRGEVFEGTGQGYRGTITVQVRMNGTDITEIIIVDSAEDRFVGAKTMEELIDLVILYNSTDIDVISGATKTSRGFLEAVGNAILRK